MLSFPKSDEFRELIQLAKREDLAGDDVTSRLLISEDQIGVGTLIQKSVGIVCGLPLVEEICRAYDERLRVEQIPGFHMEIIEGRFSDAATTPLLRIRGPLRALLSAERIILNFLQHLAGIATLTNRFVKRVHGTHAKIYDTRKTTPGLRALDKYAVRAGGGFNHRIGLYDGLLVKDNHIASRPLKELAPFLQPIVNRSSAEIACGSSPSTCTRWM
jgi:nicotinate-nucleotide pyrophosphorylase (carboxylating)